YLKDLALSLVGMELDRVPVRARERGVEVQHPLDEVIPRGDVGEARDRVSGGPAADDCPLARAQRRDVFSEEGGGAVLLSVLSKLQPGLGAPLPRKDDEDPSVGRFG